MTLNTIKNTYHKYITGKNRDVIRWGFLIAITVYLTATATPPDVTVVHSTPAKVIYWSLNGLLLLVMLVTVVLNIINAIRENTRKDIGNALCSIAVVVLCFLFVMDMYNHTVFYSLKQFLISLLA